MASGARLAGRPRGHAHLRQFRARRERRPSSDTLSQELRLVLCAAEDDDLRWSTRGALRAGATILATIDGRETRGLAERADQLHGLRPDALLVVGRERQARRLADVVEAARAAAGDEPPTQILSAGDNGLHREIQPAALGPLGFWRTPHPQTDAGAALVAHLRQLRRRDGPVLAVERLESQLAERADAPDALCCELDGASARMAFASGGEPTAVELPDVGIGEGADALVRRAGVAAIRRWLLAALDAAALRDRIANAARWPERSASDPLRLALARESLRRLVRAARDHHEASALGRPRVVVVSGALSALDPGALVAAVLDGFEPSGAFRIEAVDGAPLALVLCQAARDALRLVAHDARGSREVNVLPGELARFPLEGEVRVESEGRVRIEGTVGPGGLVVDARARPLALPERDADRLALVAAWSAALGPRR